MQKLVFGIGLGEQFKKELDAVREEGQGYASVIVDSLNYAIRKRGYRPINKMQCITDEGYVSSREEPDQHAPESFVGLYMTSFVFLDDAVDRLTTIAQGNDPRENPLWILDHIKNYLVDSQNPTRPTRPTYPEAVITDPEITLH